MYGRCVYMVCVFIWYVCGGGGMWICVYIWPLYMLHMVRVLWYVYTHGVSGYVHICVCIYGVYVVDVDVCIRCVCSYGMCGGGGVWMHVDACGCMCKQRRAPCSLLCHSVSCLEMGFFTAVQLG